MKCVWLALISATLISCSHNTFDENARFSGTYLEAVSENTRTGQAYRGVNNLYQLRVTMLTSDLLARQLDQKKNLYGWDARKTEEESMKVRQQSSSEARFFVSFFTPDSSHNNLSDKNSLWRFLLQTGSQRVVGEVKHAQMPLADLQSDYPEHDRFSVAYFVSFPIPMQNVESGDATFIMTGPLGSEEFQFAAGGKKP